MKLGAPKQEPGPKKEPGRRKEKPKRIAIGCHAAIPVTAKAQVVQISTASREISGGKEQILTLEQVFPALAKPRLPRASLRNQGREAGKLNH
jgi:hypothetical protein